MRHLFLTALLTITGCAAPVVLDPPSTRIPDGIDLSGYWILQTAEGREQPSGPTDVLVIPQDRRAPVRRSKRSDPGSSARVFLRSGDELKITQAESALFVSFDRSVVEEYRFGVLRTVSVGPIEAQRATGWAGDTLEIRTLDDDGAMLTERWRLGDGGRQLVRDVTLTHKDDTLLRATQVFRRTSGRQ